MNKVLETNVLIIGKSGVGKSSLLNYIFAEKLAETGTGRPVTEKGIFTEKLKIRNNFIVNVSDTWGLEANKAEEWRRIIMESVEKNNLKNISDWYHTIFYCISAKSARIEEFEKSIMKDLISSGNNVIVLLTHADVNNVDIAIQKITFELVAIGISNKNIITVCSIGKKLLGGRTTETFGRNEIVSAIKNNLWQTICNKLPKIINYKVEKELEEWYESCCSYLDTEIKWHNCKSKKKLTSIGDDIEGLLNDVVCNIRIYFNNKMSEVWNYYIMISEKYFAVQNITKTRVDFNLRFDFKLNSGDRLGENLAGIVANLIPFIIFFNRQTLADIRKDEIKEKLKKYKLDIQERFEIEILNEIEVLRNSNLE